MDTAPLETVSDEGMEDLDALADELFNEPAAPDATDPDPDESQPSEDEPPGQPRDASGKFAPKGDAPAPADASAPPPALPASPTTPFRFRSVGQEVPLEGAHVTPAGDLIVPKASLPHVQQLLARGHEQATVGRQREAQFRAQLAEAEAKAKQPTEAAVRANVVATELAKVLDSDEELVKFINDPTGYRENLRLRVENQLYRETSRMQQEHSSSRSVIEQQQQLQQAQETEVPAMIRELADHPSLKGKLTAEDIEAAEAHFAEFRGQLVRPATREEAQQVGVPEGSLIRVQTPVYQLLTRLAAIREEHRQQAKALADAKKHNDALKAKPKGPPVAGTPSKRDVPTPKEKPETPEERRARTKRELLDMKFEDLED